MNGEIFAVAYVENLFKIAGLGWRPPGNGGSRRGFDGKVILTDKRHLLLKDGVFHHNMVPRPGSGGGLLERSELIRAASVAYHKLGPRGRHFLLRTGLRRIACKSQPEKNRHKKQCGAADAA